MASGLPVIATRVGGNPELVSEGRTGALVPASDPEAMAQAIIAYAQAHEQARSAGQEGRAEVERRFSLDAMVGAYGSIYDRCLGVDRMSNWSDNLTS
jgi:glycosyltransferase involved in cell wall biosynthesis